MVDIFIILLQFKYICESLYPEMSYDITKCRSGMSN